MKVTANQLRDAAVAAGVRKIDHHDCSFCGYMVAYYVRDGELYFDSGCNCTSNPDSFQRRSWQSAAEWINMQTDPAHARRIAAAFGLVLPEPEG